MNKYIIAAAIIIAIIIIYNFYITTNLLNGNWMSAEEFTQKSGTEMYLNIAGIFSKDCRLIFASADESVVKDCRMVFATLPHRWLFLRKLSGYLFCDLEDFPKKMSFDFDPFAGTLRLYADKEYGNFTRVAT